MFQENSILQSSGIVGAGQAAAFSQELRWFLDTAHVRWRGCDERNE